MRLVSLLLLLAAARASAQTPVEAPPAPRTPAPASRPLADDLRAWGAYSRLGELAATDIGTGDIEFRYWGVGVTGTTGLVLRRTGEVWSGWRVEVQPCELDVAPGVMDTLSAKTLEAYRQEARRTCPPADGIGSFIEADTLVLHPLKPRLIPLAWAAIVDAGAPILPPGIARRWTVDEGYRHVVELRIGKSYRVSVIECAARPETPDDFRVQKVAGILARIFP